MKRWLILAVLCFSVNANASKNEGTVGFLVTACSLDKAEGVNQIFDQGYCVGSITASLKYLLIIERYGKSFSLPKNINVKQLMAVFLKWANQHPELWHKSDHLGMIQAVINNFPELTKSKNKAKGVLK